MVEQAAHHFAGGIQAGDGILGVGDHLAPVVDLDAAKGKGDAGSHRPAAIGGRVQGLRPVGFVDGQALGAAPVLDRGVVLNIGADGGVVFGHGAFQPVGVDVQHPRQFGNGVGFGGGGLGDPVFVPQQVFHLFVENLEGQALGLGHQGASVGDIGVVAEIGALVQEALAVDIDDEAEGVGMFLEQLGYGAVAEGGGIHVPGHGVAG